MPRAPHWRPTLPLVAILAAACGQPGEPSSRTSEAIIGGTFDPSDGAVVALLQPSTGTLCSGTLVAPTLVLTAAHCVSGIPASDLRVLVGINEMSPDLTVAVSATATYPTFEGESEGLPGGVDMAFVTLAMPLSVTPIVVRTDTTDAELTGADVTVVGYGAIDGTDSSGAGARREVVLPVSSVCSRILQAGGTDANACVGDSGGAVLLGGKLVAIVSGGQEGCHTASLFTRTDAHADWIRAVLAGQPSTPCAHCVTPDPACSAPTETGVDAGTVDAGVAGGAYAGGSSCSMTVAPRDRDMSASLLLVGLVVTVCARRRAFRARAAASPRR